MIERAIVVPTAVAGCAAAGVIVISVVLAAPASAVPSFAQQTGQPCQSCHVGAFGPQLTPFGRDFKLRGYTMRTKAFNLPLSGMAVASFVHTSKDQASAPADDFGTNDNFALDEASIFLAGGIGSHFGGFVQTTYDGVEKAWALDNLDLRVVGTGQVAGADLVYGVSLNNNPTTQDVWNTLPGWGYPYTDSALAPGPATSPLIDGGLAQNVVGLTGYAWVDSKFYLEAGGYTSPRAGTLRWLGADPTDPGDIAGLAPYGRVAYQHALAGGTFELGAFGLKAAIRPGRDRSTGHTDHYSDVGLDASWIKTTGSGDVITFNGRYTHEHYALDATCLLGDGSLVAAGLAECADGNLDEEHIDASYYWRNQIGVTVGAFNITGSTNPSLYGDNRTFNPDSQGITLQLDETLFGRSSAPLGPRVNIRVGVQYTAYTKFNGARSNYDGAGTSASDNNTLRAFTWIAF